MLRSDLNCFPFEKVIAIIDILNSFQGKYNKKLNFTELAKHFGFSPQETHLIADLILKMQETFHSTFKEHILEKKIEKGFIYLKAEKYFDEIPKSITLQKDHLEKLGDIIYTFLEVKRGKGFELEDRSSKLSALVRSVRAVHPYFFYKNGSNLVYPTKFGLELGLKILSYKKLSRPIFNLIIDRHEIKVEPQ